MSLSQEQLERRLEGITATDVSAIVGVNPYRTRIDVWREKRGEAPPWIETERSRWGTLLEPILRADYEERHNVRVEQPGTLEHPDTPWMKATPDGVAYARDGVEPLNGLEIKVHTFRLAHLYGAPGTDEVPLYELCQCAWNMGVTGLSRWDLVPFIDAQPAEYIIDRDDELIGNLTEQAERFLVDNVRGGAVPEPDGSESFNSWLKTRWEKNTESLVDIGDDNDTFTLIERGKELREREVEIDDELTRLVQTLKLKIGDGAGLTWKDARGKVEKLTWKRNRAGKITDHAGMANDVVLNAGLLATGVRGDVANALAGKMPPAKVLELLSQLYGKLVDIGSTKIESYTRSKPGNRPFTWPKNWKARPERKEER